MSIGSTIKRLRRERGITQEQLAEYLGITSRAVSQWECDRTAPDISLLPALCHIFGVSSDVLLEIDMTKQDEEMKAYLSKANDLGNQGEGKARTALLREANRRFPRDYKIMGRLADSLVCEYSRAGVRNYGEVFALCHRVLSECTDSVTRYEAIDTLAAAYDYAGKTAEMLQLAEQMPRAHFSYESFMNFRWQGDADFEQRQAYISHLLFELFSSVAASAAHPHDDGTPIYTEKERMALWRCQVALLDAVFPDGDYQSFAEEGEIACRQLIKGCLQDGDTEGAWQWLSRAADFAIHMDTCGDAAHTSSLLRGYRDGGRIPEADGTCTQCLLDWLTTDAALCALHSDARYEALVKRLQIVARNP